MKESLAGRIFKEAGWAGVYGPLMEKAANEILRLTAELEEARAVLEAWKPIKGATPAVSDGVRARLDQINYRWHSGAKLSDKEVGDLLGIAYTLATGPTPADVRERVRQAVEWGIEDAWPRYNRIYDPHDPDDESRQEWVDCITEQVVTALRSEAQGEDELAALVVHMWQLKEQRGPMYTESGDFYADFRRAYELAAARTNGGSDALRRYVEAPKAHICDGGDCGLEPCAETPAHREPGHARTVRPSRAARRGEGGGE